MHFTPVKVQNEVHNFIAKYIIDTYYTFYICLETVVFNKIVVVHWYAVVLCNCNSRCHAMLFFWHSHS